MLFILCLCCSYGRFVVLVCVSCWYCGDLMFDCCIIVCGLWVVYCLVIVLMYFLDSLLMLLIVSLVFILVVFVQLLRWFCCLLYCLL